MTPKKRETKKGALHKIMTMKPRSMFGEGRNLRLRRVVLLSQGHTAGEL